MRALLKRVANRNFVKSVVILTKASLRDQYKNSYLGIIWSLLQPAVNILILSVVFSLLWRMPGGDFYVYITSGIVAWQFMVNCMSKAAGSISSRGGIFKHVMIPKSTFILADICSQIYVFFITLTIVYVSSLFVTGFRIGTLWLPLMLIPLFIFTISASVILAYVSAYVWDVPHLVGVMFTVLFWTIPISYNISMIPEHAQVWFLNNPFYIIIHPVQHTLYYAELPPMQEYWKAMVLAFFTSFVAYRVFRKLHRNVIYYL